MYDLSNGRRKWYRAKWQQRHQPHFLVFFLHVKNRILGYSEAARGGIDSCAIDPRVIFRAALHAGASAIIVSHNHPSGDCTPSNEDLALTKRLRQASELLGIQLLDHVIVSDVAQLSFCERQML